jgi:DNA-binding response OmpR family regulator
MMVTQKRRKILVVDDDGKVLDRIRQILEEGGYDVLTSLSALGTSNLIDAEHPDLVILDVRMPTLKGPQVVQILRNDRDLRSVPVVFYSSLDDSTLRKLVQESGANGYLSKSLRAAELLQRVAVYLDRLPVAS